VLISRDTLFDGDVCCSQHKDGYRFSIDSVLLAHFVRLKKEELLLDLGAGCGVLGFILLYRACDFIKKLTAFELQEGLADLARGNVLTNSCQDTMDVVRGDLRCIERYFSAGGFSSVVCNPPFYTSGSGRKSANDEALIARHQVGCNLREILHAANYVLKNRGRFFLVYPAELLAALIARLSKTGFAVKRMQLVYSYPEKEGTARLVLLEALKNGGDGMRVESPLYIYSEKDGEYSEVVQKMYQRNS
jgi:tRNA1Val (adenine37-N6)-methyltransferase